MFPSNATAPLANVIIIAAILVAALHLMAALATPILVAFVLVAVTAPVISGLERRGLPQRYAILAVAGTVVLIILALTVLVSISLLELQQALPAYRDVIGQQTALIESWLAARGIDIGLPALQEPGSGTAFIPTIGAILTELGVLAAGFLVLIVAIVFMLGDFPGIAFRISQALGDTAALTAAFDRFNRRLTTYAAVKAGVGFITGGGLTVLLLIMGVETPILWGLLIFLFSFIPFIGLPIASVPPAGVAGLQYGIWGVAAVLAGVAIIDLAARTLLFPQRIDRICDLSNAVIMLSVFFWTWVLGVPGLFLAVPLTMFAKMGLESSDETRWMAVLLKPPITQE